MSPIAASTASVLEPRVPSAAVPNSLPPLRYTLGFAIKVCEQSHARCSSSGRRTFSMSSAAVSYARENQKRFLDELKDLLRIPSVSTAEEHKDDIRKAAEMVANDLKRIGFEHVETISTQGHPWFTPTGCTPRASPRRYAMRITTCSRPSRGPVAHSAVRAHRAQSEHLRARRRGRQGPALDAAQGVRVAVQGWQRHAAHQRPRARSTRVKYALKTTTTSSTRFGPIPTSEQIPDALTSLLVT